MHVYASVVYVWAHTSSFEILFKLSCISRGVKPFCSKNGTCTSGESRTAQYMESRIILARAHRQAHTYSYIRTHGHAHARTQRSTNWRKRAKRPKMKGWLRTIRVWQKVYCHLNHFFSYFSGIGQFAGRWMPLLLAALAGGGGVTIFIDTVTLFGVASTFHNPRTPHDEYVERISWCRWDTFMYAAQA